MPFFFFEFQHVWRWFVMTFIDPPGHKSDFWNRFLKIRRAAFIQPIRSGPWKRISLRRFPSKGIQKITCRRMKLWARGSFFQEKTLQCCSLLNLIFAFDLSWPWFHLLGLPLTPPRQLQTETCCSPGQNWIGEFRRACYCRLSPTFFKFILAMETK